MTLYKSGRVILLALFCFFLKPVFGQYHWENSKMIHDSIKDTALSQIKIDQLDNKWISGMKGLYKIAPDGKTFLYNSVNSPLSDRTHVMEVDDVGNLWIENEGALVKFDGTSWTVYNNTNSSFPGGRILCIKYRNGILWMTLSKKGLVKLENGNFTSFNTSNSNIPTNEMVRLTIDSHGIVWVYSTNKELIKFDGEKFTTYSKFDNGKPLPAMVDIGIDNDQKIYMGTYGNGLLIFDGKSFTNPKPNVDDNTMSAPYLDTEGNLWFLTLGGNLMRYDGTNWLNYYANSGIETGYAFFQGMAIDSSGKFWITTAYSGLYVLSGKEMSDINPAEQPLKDQYVSVYPNPANNSFSIYIQNPAQRGEISIYNVTGRLVKVFQTQDQYKIYPIESATLGEGLFYISYTSGNIMRACKLIITH